MASKAPKQNIDESKLTVTKPKTTAVGIPAVANALKISLEQMGPLRSIQTLLAVNQVDGFDCMGCAWPEHEKRNAAEFCENGAKAVAEEGTRRRVTPEFFAQHSISDLKTRDDYWLGQQGRLTHPMLLEEGATHYEPIEWDDAYELIAQEIRDMEHPDQSVFYTSGRTSNEAAFAYQLLVRGIGTNNLPDCSNMCHESSGSALVETIGIGKGSVSLTDLETASLIFVAGQNPGTNHPRMLSALEKAKKNGAVIISVNPLPEAGLLRFENPQNISGMVVGTQLTDDFLQIRAGGDQALFQGLGKYLLEAEAQGRKTPGLPTVLDHEFIKDHTVGIDEYLRYLEKAEWDDIVEATGLTLEQIKSTGERLLASSATIVCWAMGLTQHKHSVPTLRDVVNVLLLQGNIGKPGAGVCPVRGHSNVQGDRTMGIFEKMPESFHDRLDHEFQFLSPRAHGFDTVAAIRAMRDGKIRVFIGMGGNFVRAAPDSEVTEQALANTRLTVQISTKLNHSHVSTGRRALILPTLGRTEKDTQRTGDQRVTVEDSMSAVHASRGRLKPASEHLHSEVAIVCNIAHKIFTGSDDLPLPNTPKADWLAMRDDYSIIRKHIEAVLSGFENFEERIQNPGGFVLPHPPRDARKFDTASGKAHFTGNELEFIRVPAGRLVLQTLRSHDQYNTTIYGKDDRYRGIHGGRRVVMINADDITELGFTDGDMVHLISEFQGTERRAENFRIVSYSTPKGCAAAYYPETNVLVPLDSVADTSGTPTSKSVIVRLERAEA
ncbi:FdhF/YdeP family oxidoreductase [Pseudarthrobacter sp. NIBRBAC000502772]|uniref:FdhF/YdeP family oxidoreductase n=1 Tax=Pseudarthrobacter sp. NIBRBAC000502772 TaxID=2590775 RepID=UPI0011300B3D|nr:FdhF/YdeP family oxidoreductase [Pseudarthrobacter sp. NIBRBAC000502772]QDG65331.1 FdhF/YdeP family oxidoreductase [Pseudarthrobacter sp. NIBRBAC000502772]